MKCGSGKGIPAGSAEGGFTLFDVLVTIALIAVVSSFALPEVRAWNRAHRFKAEARELFSHLQLARLEAIKRNGFCTVVFNATVGEDRFDYIVFVDKNQDRRYAVGEKLLVRASFETAGFDLSRGSGDGVTFINNAAGEPAVAWNHKGLPVTENHKTCAGSVFLKNESGRTQTVVTSWTGAIRVE